MRAYCTLVMRELGTYFKSWTGYVVIAAVLWMLGLSFLNLIYGLNNAATDRPATELFFSTLYFWLVLLLVAPLMTMRSFAQEKFTGTFEALMTTPVGDLQVVLAKFSGALLFHIIAWLPPMAYLFILRALSSDPYVLESGALIGTYLGIVLLGAMFLSIGCFTSSVTRSQVIAAVGSFALSVLLFFLSFLSLVVPGGGWRGQAMSYLGLVEHMEDFASGVLDTRPVILYLSVTALFLCLTFKVVESRRWK